MLSNGDTVCWMHGDDDSSKQSLLLLLKLYSFKGHASSSVEAHPSKIEQTSQ